MRRPSRGVGRPKLSPGIVRPLTLLLVVGWAVGSGASTAFGPPASPSTCPFLVTLAANPDAGSPPLLVRLTAAVTGGTPSYFSWNFGDGTYWNASGNGASNPLHRFASAGIYHPAVNVSESGCVVTDAVTVAVSASPLGVTLIAHPSSGPVPLTVTFNATVSGGSATYTSATWDFGDGDHGSGLGLAYTYQSTGTYVAEVNVTDSSGHWAVATVTIAATPASRGSSPLSYLQSMSPWVWVVLIGLAVLGGAVVVARRIGGAATITLADRASAPSAPHPPTPPEPGGVASAAVPASGPGGTMPEVLEPSGPEAPVVVPAPDRSDVEAGHPSSSPRPSKDSIGLTQKVILHIGRQGRLPTDSVAPAELTQQGITLATGARQNTLTNVLRRLVAAGVLAQDVRHVRGRDRRLRVYYFTARGESVYSDLRRSSEVPRPPARDRRGDDPTGRK